MVQNQIIRHNVAPTVRQTKTRKSTKKAKISENTVKTVTPPKCSQHSVDKTNLPAEKEETETGNSNGIEEESHVEKEAVTIVKEDIKKRIRDDRLAREKQTEEELERIVKEAAERKAAEREEIIRQAKRFILYRKPMCRRINQGFLLSECLRELDAQLKFRETLKNINKEQEIAQVNLMKDDVAKYQKEMKQKAEEQLEKRRNYAIELKRQIEENKNTLLIKNKEEFEAEKQDQINMIQCLQDMKEYEAQQLQNKKERLKKFFNDAIEEKKQFDLKLKDEEEFENRANEIYRNAKLQIQKIHKAVVQKEREEKEKKAELISEKFRTFLKSKKEVEERILKKAQEEQEEQYKEEQRMKQEREIQIRKELQNFQMEAMAKKAKQLQEERELKTWEIMQRFKKAECDKDREAEERKQQWNKKIEYAKSLKKYISEKEAEREQEKLAEDEAINMNKIIEIENKKILDYAEEVINESKGVRPLYPILKAVEECKKEMGLIPPKKREEVISTEPKRRRKIRRCTKVVPEDKICYL